MRKLLVLVMLIGTAAVCSGQTVLERQIRTFLRGICYLDSTAIKKITPAPRLTVSGLSGATPDTLDLAQQGAVTGQVLTWDGAWVPRNPSGGGGLVDAVADSADFRAYNRNGFNVLVMRDSVRGGLFRRCYSCVADQYMVFTDALSRKWQRYGFKAASAKWFGAYGDGIHNDSAAIQRAFSSVYDVHFPTGTYKVGTHTISAAKTIWGNGAILQQSSALASSAVIISVLADNVTIRDIELRGQISTQTSEFSHGIAVGPNVGDGPENFKIENVKIRDVRGDGVIFRGTTRPCRNAIVINVDVRNAYRNGIAIIHGHNIHISAFDADSVGLAGIDIEPDLVTQTNRNIVAEAVKISSFWCGHHEDTTTVNVTLKGFEIDGNRSGSFPSYPSAATYSTIGIATRHANNFSVSDGIIHNCAGYAIYFSTAIRKARNVRFQNITVENNCWGSWVNYAKLINQDESNSDSCATFVNCRFSGDGVIDQLGAPAGSVFENCEITRFDRLLISSRGNMRFRKCVIECYNDLLYDSYGPSTFEGCNITCSYVVRGHSGAAVYVWRDCEITTSVTPLPYTFFGPTPSNTRFVWKNNRHNGSYVQSLPSGGTIFSSDVLATGSSASTLILPDVLLYPLNEIRVLNAYDGRIITFDPEGPTLANGASTASIQTNTTIYTDGTSWYTRKDGVFSVSGSNGVSATTTGGNVDVRLGGTLSQNTTISGGGAYDLTFSSPATRHRMQSKPLMLDVSDTPLYLGGGITNPSTEFPDLAAGGAVYVTGNGSGINAGYGNIVIRPRANNAFRVTCDGGTTSEMDISPGSVVFNGTATYSNNLFLKGSIGSGINLTNKNNFGTVPVYKGTMTWQGSMWIGNLGDVPLVIECGVTGFPSSVGADLGSFLGTSGGGASGTPFYDYGNLLARARAGKHIYLLDGSTPLVTCVGGKVGIGLGMSDPTDTLHVAGTVKLEDLPDHGIETEFLWIGSDHRVARGNMPASFILPNNIQANGVTAGTYGGFYKFPEISVDDRGFVTDISHPTHSIATYASSIGGTTLTWQSGDYAVSADPTLGNLDIQLGGMEDGQIYKLYVCCNLTYSVSITGNVKVSGQYGTNTSYTAGAGEHLEIIYNAASATYYVSKQ